MVLNETLKLNLMAESGYSRRHRYGRRGRGGNGHIAASQKFILSNQALEAFIFVMHPFSGHVDSGDLFIH